MNLQQVADKALDFGEVYYMVDSDYRTQAQGWTRADRTGPLDLILARANAQHNYVFRTSDYGSDSLAVTAAVNQMIDYRGDALLFTPGAYSLGAVVAVDVPDARLLGPKCSAPQVARASITAAIAAALTVSVDRVEVGFLKFVPLTAATLFSLSAGADNLHFHDFYYDSNGIAASTSTIFVTAAGNTNDDLLFNRFHYRTDAAQGPLISIGATYEGLVIRDWTHMHNAGTLAVSLLTTAGAAAGTLIENGHGFIAGGGAVTNLVSIAEGGLDTAHVSIRRFRGTIGYCAASGLINENGSEAAEINLSACYLDVVDGGAGGEGTTYTA